MMGAFLDALGITHENGLIEDEAVAPDPAKVGAGGRGDLPGSFPREARVAVPRARCCARIRRPGAGCRGCPNSSWRVNGPARRPG